MSVTAVGVDPGVQRTGLASWDAGRLVHSTTLRGSAGAGKDWALLSRTARLLALSVSAYVLEAEPRVVAVETMEDQSGRMTYRWKHTTAAVCQAVYDRAVEEGWEGLIVWQKAREVLAHTAGGSGLLKYLLEQGRAGPRVGAPGPLNEHEASAAAHASHAEAVYRSAAAGGAARG